VNASIEAIANVIVESIKNGGKLMVCGNGGSNAQAQHLVAELLIRYKLDRPPIPAMCLDMDPSTLSASCNDFSFEQHYGRMVQAFGRPGDCLLAISTSGTSENVNNALLRARVLSIQTLGILGGAFGTPALLACETFVLSNKLDTPLIQEEHAKMCHLLAELVEAGLYGTDS
jgi:D-sedoheptulose 7-phosphate isomerase